MTLTQVNIIFTKLVNSIFERNLSNYYKKFTLNFAIFQNYKTLNHHTCNLLNLASVLPYKNLFGFCVLVISSPVHYPLKSCSEAVLMSSNFEQSEAISRNL